MTYARSYATSRRPQKIKKFRRPANKRKIPKLHFRQNARSRPSLWPKIKALILTTGCLIGALTVLAGFSLVLVISYQYLLNIPYFCIKSKEGITILGQERSHPEAVLREMQLRPGTSLLAVQPLKVEKALLQQPWIEAAELSRVWPDQVRLVIREHQPVALVKIDHRLYLMNSRGILFKAMEPHDPHEFPVLTGLELIHFQRVAGNMTPLLAKVFDLMELLQERDNFLSWQNIAEIHVDAERGFTVYPTDLHIGLNIGFHDYKQKLANLQKVLPHIKQHGELARIEHIDLNYPQRVLVRLKQHERLQP
ncbi:MAG: cell division protein FtsQ/DivIB [Desulfobacca sp.]|uniref:cell division protein FtsQ/DivIB n=1 Tax=Desulfobacca sp. TaxID=2067990 RepID=UPI0040494B4C